MNTYIITANLHKDDCDCGNHEQHDDSIRTAIRIEAESSVEALEQFHDQNMVDYDISYTVQHVEIVETDVFRFMVEIQQAMKDVSS